MSAMLRLDAVSGASQGLSPAVLSHRSSPQSRASAHRSGRAVNRTPYCEVGAELSWHSRVRIWASMDIELDVLSDSRVFGVSAHFVLRGPLGEYGFSFKEKSLASSIRGQPTAGSLLPSQPRKKRKVLLGHSGRWLKQKSQDVRSGEFRQPGAPIATVCLVSLYHDGNPPLASASARYFQGASYSGEILTIDGMKLAHSTG